MRFVLQTLVSTFHILQLTFQTLQWKITIRINERKKAERTGFLKK